jgi:hypothetical protein
MLHPVNVKSYMIEGVWPHVRDDDWCGQWMSPARAARADSTPAVQPARAATDSATARAPAVAVHPRPAMLTPVPASASAAASAAPATKAMHAGD